MSDCIECGESSDDVRGWCDPCVQAVFDKQDAEIAALKEQPCLRCSNRGCPHLLPREHPYNACRRSVVSGINHDKCFVRLSTPADILAAKDAEIAALKEQAKGCCGNLLSIYGPEVIAEAERQAKIEVLKEVLEAEVPDLNYFADQVCRELLKQLEADQ
jgi:hypothetical protein